MLLVILMVGIMMCDAIGDINGGNDDVVLVVILMVGIMICGAGDINGRINDMCCW